MSIDITKDLVSHIANLGMLKVDDKEMGTYLSHLSKVLKNIEELEAVNTDDVLPFANPMRERLTLFRDHNDRRDDKIAPSLPVQEILKNAPDQKLNQFAANPTQVDQYLSGKDRVFGFCVGLMMKETKGQANPQIANDIMKKILDSKKGIK